MRTLGKALKNSTRVVDRHLQDFGDVLALVEDLQRLAVVALAFADLAGHGDVGQELHLDLDVAVALAGLAAAALDVEAEAAGLVAAQARFRHGGEELADWREQAGVGRRVRARRAADRRLVDVDHLVEVAEALESRSGRGGRARWYSTCAAFLYRISVISVLLPEPETPVTQTNLPSGIVDVDVLEVVLAGALDLDDVAVAGAAEAWASGSRGGR